MIKVLLADDHALFRRGLRSMLALEDDILIVGEAADGQEAQELAAELQPDIVLLDINMPRVTGIQAAQELRRAHPNLGIVMLTMFAEDEIVEEALAAGADGYLRKDTPFDDLVATVRQVADALQLLARDRGVGIEADMPADELMVLGDRDELIRVFENLIENALKYGASGKRVDVVLSRAFTVSGGEEAVAAVRDLHPSFPRHLPDLIERYKFCHLPHMCRPNVLKCGSYCK